MPIFHYEITQKGTIDISQKALDAVDDEFREILYNLNTDLEIAEHLVFNLVVNQAELSMLDGFLDLSNNEAVLKEDQEAVIEVSVVPIL